MLGKFLELTELCGASEEEGLLLGQTLWDSGIETEKNPHNSPNVKKIPDHIGS